MSKRAKKPCNKPGCGILVDAGIRYCKKHISIKKSNNKYKQYKPVDESKPLKPKRKPSSQRGYNARWRRARKYYLMQHPLCVSCLKEDKLVPAYAVDHIVPHKGNKELFWNEDNWQSLCQVCHNRKSRYEQEASYDTTTKVVKSNKKTK